MIRRFLSLALCFTLCLLLCACTQDTPTEPVDIPTASTGEDSILVTKAPTKPVGDFTPVYVSAFENTIVLATIPLEEWEGMEAECSPREISQGGCVSCNGEHERETPITRVIILEELVPRSTAQWFRNMIKLESIEGLDLVHMDMVTDMNHMFTACEKLTKIKETTWNLSSVTDMTGIFDGCIGLTEYPDWYIG